MSYGKSHVVIVEALDAFTDLLAANEQERESLRGLGLPIAEIAERMDADVTVLSWDEWEAYPWVRGSFLGWVDYPATRPVEPTSTRRPVSAGRVTWRQVPATDPTSGRPLADGVSPASLGLLADSDAHFFASFRLHHELLALHAHSPISLLVVPMWGGLGYMPQVVRATGLVPAVGVPTAVVVTDTSARKQLANEEGYWTRPAVTRRQMEDLSLALADVVLTFGPRGDTVARLGRPPGTPPPVRVVRAVPDEVLERIAAAGSARSQGSARDVRFVIEEPQEPASGVLAVLDATHRLNQRGQAPPHPVIAAGPDMRFAPMSPRSFVEYWSSRGFVKELLAESRWLWTPTRPLLPDSLTVRMYPSHFDHLPAVWMELAQGSLVVLSLAAAEGLLPHGDVRSDLLLGETPDAAEVAAMIDRIGRVSMPTLDAWRRALCHDVIAAYRGPAYREALDRCAAELGAAITSPSVPQDLSGVATLLIDRGMAPGAMAARWQRPSSTETAAIQPSGKAAPMMLSVVVTCYDLAETIRETLESVWASTRMPDEVIVVDDGSRRPETAEQIEALETMASARGVPFRLLRQSNGGLVGARNLGLAAAKGRFISFLDADDLVLPEFYGLATKLLDENAGLGGVSCWAYIFGQDMDDMYWNAPQPELPLLLVENQVVVPCVMRTALVRDLRGYDPDLRYNYEDWEMSLHLLAKGHPIVTLPAYLHRYRVRRDSLFRSMTAAQHLRMREVFFTKHAGTARRFGVEVAMLLEHERGKVRYAVKPAPLTDNASARTQDPA